MSPPFVLPTGQLPLSPPQSLPPSPPSPRYTHYHAPPSLSQRAAHAFPSTPGASPAADFAPFGGTHAEEERVFRFPVPEGHLLAPTNGLSADDDDDEGTVTVGAARHVVLPSARAKGVFKKAFLADLPALTTTASSRPPVGAARSASHGRSSSVASSSSAATAAAAGRKTHAPSESMLGLTGIDGLSSVGKKVKWRKDTDGADEAPAPAWVHRRALLPTVSRRWRRMLALVLLVCFALITVRAARGSEDERLSDVGRLLRQSYAVAPKARPHASASSASIAAGANGELLAGWTWHEGEELAALFLTSEDTHAIPPMANDAKIDPELVLDFDPLRSVALADDMNEMVEHVWRERPVVLLGKGHGDPTTRDLKHELLDLHTRPAPSILELESRADADRIVPIFERLTDTPLDDFPVLLVGGRKVDPALWKKSQLRDLVLKAGASIIPPKVKRPVPANPAKA